MKATHDLNCPIQQCSDKGSFFCMYNMIMWSSVVRETNDVLCVDNSLIHCSCFMHVIVEAEAVNALSLKEIAAILNVLS